MIAYQTFCQLREAWDEQHLTMAQIARALHVHPQTVKKWVSRPRYEQRRAPRLVNDDLNPDSTTI